MQDDVALLVQAVVARRVEVLAMEKSDAAAVVKVLEGVVAEGHGSLVVQLDLAGLRMTDDGEQAQVLARIINEMHQLDSLDLRHTRGDAVLNVLEHANMKRLRVVSLDAPDWSNVETIHRLRKIASSLERVSFLLEADDEFSKHWPFDSCRNVTLRGLSVIPVPRAATEMAAAVAVDAGTSCEASGTGGCNGDYFWGGSGYVFVDRVADHVCTNRSWRG